MTTMEMVPTDATEVAALAAPPLLFGTDDPRGIIARATAVAEPLAKVIRDRQLYVQFRGSEHVTIGGWTLLGSMLGVFPITAWCRPVQGGWEARVEARTLAGALVGAAEAQCTADEPNWKPGQKTDNQRRSMAQTRAASKSLRQCLGFVMTLAGYSETPAEEMDPIEMTARPAPSPRSPLPASRSQSEQRGPGALAGPEDKKRLVDAAKAAGLSEDDLRGTIREQTGKVAGQLTLADIERLIAAIAGPEPVDGAADLLT